MAVDRISNTTNTLQVGQKSAAEERAQVADSAKESVDRAAPADRVSITSTASLLQQAEEALKTAPDVDVKRVEAIKKAIENGTFEIDANRVAEELIAFESTLNKAGRG